MKLEGKKHYMKLLFDLHTHTLPSGHAYSTIDEMAKEAAAKGLDLLGISEHAPAMPGTCGIYYFQNLKVVPRRKHGVDLMLGSELNIIDYQGNVDMDIRTMKEMDINIAGFHLPCIEPGTIEQNTSAVIGAIKNPYINIIGHPDDSRYPLDYEAVVCAAKEHHTLLELNNASLNPDGFRLNTYENDTTMLKLCKKHAVPIVISSDSHVSNDVGAIYYAMEIIHDVEFPEELIVNTKRSLLFEALSYKKNRSGFYEM